MANTQARPTSGALASLCKLLTKSHCLQNNVHLLSTTPLTMHTAMIWVPSIAWAGALHEDPVSWTVVCRYIMLSGLPPFWGPNTRECFNNIMTAAPSLEGDLWDSVSQLGKDFIRRCAHVRPSCRLQLRLKLTCEPTKPCKPSCAIRSGCLCSLLPW